MCSVLAVGYVARRIHCKTGFQDSTPYCRAHEYLNFFDAGGAAGTPDLGTLDGKHHQFGCPIGVAAVANDHGQRNDSGYVDPGRRLFADKVLLADLRRANLLEAGR